MSAADPVWVEWSPAPERIRGRYTERVWDADARMHEPQQVHAECLECGARWQTVCQSGHVRDHIATFARVHFHGDPLAAPKVVRPTSLRTEEVERRRREGGG